MFSLVKYSKVLISEPFFIFSSVLDEINHRSDMIVPKRRLDKSVLDEKS